MLKFALILFVSSLANLALGAYVLKKKPHSRTHQLFGLLALSVSIWVLSNAFYQIWFGYPFTNISYSSGAFVPPLLLLWVSELAKRPVSKVLKIIMLVLAASFFILALVPDLIITSLGKLKSFGFEAVPGPLFTPFFVYLLFFLIWSIVKLFSSWRYSTGIQKERLSYVILAIALPSAVIAIVDYLLPLFGILWLASFDALSSFIFLGLLTYAITRYRFMDIRVVLRKGIVQVVIFVTVVALYVYIVFFLQSIATREVRIAGEVQNSNIFLLISVVIIALTIEPLRRLVTRLVNQLIFKRKNGHKPDIQLRRGGSITDLNQLQNSIELYLKEKLNIRRVQLVTLDRRTGTWSDVNDKSILDAQSPIIQYLNLRKQTLVAEEIPFLIEERPESEGNLLKECRKRLEQMSVGLVEPLKGFNEDVLGVILVSNKPTRRPFSVEDIESVNRVSNTVSPVLANAVMYREILPNIH